MMTCQAPEDAIKEYKQDFLAEPQGSRKRAGSGTKKTWQTYSIYGGASAV